MRLDFIIGTDRRDGDCFRCYLASEEASSDIDFRTANPGVDTYEMPGYGCRLEVFHPIDFEIGGGLLRGRLSGRRGGIFQKGARKALRRLSRYSGIKLCVVDNGK